MKSRVFFFLFSKQGKQLAIKWVLAYFSILLLAFALDRSHFFDFFKTNKANFNGDVECSLIKDAKIAVNGTSAQVYVRISKKDDFLLFSASNFIRVVANGSLFSQEFRFNNSTKIEFAGKRFIASFFLEQNGKQKLEGFCFNTKLFETEVDIKGESKKNITFFDDSKRVQNACVTQDTLFINTKSYLISKPSIANNFAYTKLQHVDGPREEKLYIVGTSLNKFTNIEKQNQISKILEQKINERSNSKVLFFMNQKRTGTFSNISSKYSNNMLNFSNNSPVCFSSIEEISL